MRQTTFRLALTALLLGPGGGAFAQFDSRFYDGPPGAVAARPDQVPALARALDAESGRLVPTVLREIGGTRQGRLLVVSGNATRGAAQVLMQTVMAGGDARTILARVDQFSRSLNAVQGDLNRPPGTAPASIAISHRMERLAFEIRRALTAGGRPAPNPGFPPVDPGFGPGPSVPRVDTGRLNQLTQSAAAQLNATSSYLAADVGQAPPFDGVMLDLQAIEMGVQQVNNLGFSGAALPQLRDAYRAVHDRALQVNFQFQGGGPRVDRARLSWNAAAVSLNGLSGLLGLPPDIVPNPVVPTVPVVTPGFRPGQGFPRRPLLFATDQLIGELDGFVAAVSPNVLSIPEGPAFIADARALRGSAINLRQSASGGAPPAALVPAFGQLEQTYSRLLNRINRVSRGRPGANVDRIRRMGSIVDQIRGAIPA